VCGSSHLVDALARGRCRVRLRVLILWRAQPAHAVQLSGSAVLVLAGTVMRPSPDGQGPFDNHRAAEAVVPRFAKLLTTRSTIGMFRGYGAPTHVR
jgi:hypothetical protein